MKNKEILFCLRRDAVEKPGGDTGKVYKYEPILNKLGYSVRIVSSPFELDALEKLPDVVHILNTQTPYENYKYFKWARKNGIPVYFSTIHHEQSYMEKYYKQSAIGRLLGYSVYQFTTSLAKEIIRYKTLRNISSFLKLPKSICREIISGSHKVLPLSEIELFHIENDFDISIHAGKFSLIPNGLTFRGCDTQKHTKDIDVLVVGRIEPRKNQLKIAQALKGKEHKVVFIGKENKNHSQYLKDFHDLVGSSENLLYLGEKTQVELADFYRRTNVCLSNSWFEVVSQVDLEATSMGCKPIISKASSIFDYFSSPPISLDPECSHSEIEAAINLALSESYMPRIKDEYNLSWVQVTEKLSSAYQKSK